MSLRIPVSCKGGSCGGARTRNQGGPDTWQQFGTHKTDRHEDGPYLDLDRHAWRGLRAISRLPPGCATRSGRFSDESRPAPFIIAVAGSVAVGKSATARVLQTLVRKWPQHPHPNW